MEINCWIWQERRHSKDFLVRSFGNLIFSTLQSSNYPASIFHVAVCILFNPCWGTIMNSSSHWFQERHRAFLSLDRPVLRFQLPGNKKIVGRTSITFRRRSASHLRLQHARTRKYFGGKFLIIKKYKIMKQAFWLLIWFKCDAAVARIRSPQALATRV